MDHVRQPVSRTNYGEFPESTPRVAVAWLGGLGLLLAAFLAHGWCLHDGSVLDDHWHQHNLRTIGWSVPELVRGTVIEPAQFVHLWWQDKPVRWEYARPLFIFLMKVIYRGFGDDPLGLHLFSVLLHALCAILTWRLALRFGCGPIWSWLAGLLLVVYPHAVMTVQWPSAQNVVLQTALLLAALLMHLRAATDASFQRWTAAALGLWLLALFARENALLFPGFLVALDLSLGGWKRVRARVGLYAAYGLIAMVFVLWRVSVITQGMPDVYQRRPDGDLIEYVGWSASKLLHYFCTAVWLAPMTIGPTGRFNPWSEVPGEQFRMLGILALVAAVFWACTRHARGWWLWPVWILLAMLPVVPIVATPHSGYPAGVAVAVGFAIGASRLSSATRRPRATAHVSRTLMIASVIAMGVLTMLNRWQWTGTIAVEKLLERQVMADPPEAATTDLFFINIPFANIYCKPQLDRALPSIQGARAHILAFAPQPFLNEERVYVDQVDDRAFSLEIAGQPFFSRLLGRFLVDGFRTGGAFQSGDTIGGRDFTVTIDRADSEGVWKMTFRFPRPLSDPRYCFYLASSQSAAARIRFSAGPLSPGSDASGGGSSQSSDHTSADSQSPSPATVALLAGRLREGDRSAFDLLRVAGRSQDEAVSRAADRAVREVLGPVAAGVGARVQEALLGPHVQPDALAPPPRVRPPAPPPPLPPLTANEWNELDRWLSMNVPSKLIKTHWSDRPAIDALIKLREELPHARQWAAMLLRSDLYLTGPPFPGPRPRPDGK